MSTLQAAVTIRDANESDKEGIWRVHTASIEKVCSSHYSSSDVEVWSKRQRPEKYTQFILRDTFVVAESTEDGQVLGFGHMGSCDSAARTHTARLSASHQKGCELAVKGLYVSPEFIQKGIGKALYRELERRAKACGCARLLVASTLNAVTFYEACGFHAIAQGTHCASGQQMLQCVNMQKILTGNPAQTVTLDQ